MGFFQKVVEKLKFNKSHKEQGNFIGVPNPLKRLSEYIPVFEKGQSIGILAATGVGKSKFTRWMFIYNIYDFCKKHGYNAHMLYFPLEDNKEKIYFQFICHYLKKEHDIVITTQELTSKKGSLPEWVLTAVIEAEEYFSDFEKYVTVVDYLSSAEDIYGLCEKWALKNGKIYYKDVTDQTGRLAYKIPIKYFENENAPHTFVIVDNMSNFDSERSFEEREAMIKFSKIYARRNMCNVFGFTVVQVMQMAFDKERQQFTTNGMSIVSKIEPSLDGIGEAKVIARSMHLIFGIFNPDRYELMSYPNNDGYNIGILGSRFRAIKVLKSNDSDPGMRVGLLFDPIGEIFRELPLPKDEAMQQIYNQIKEAGQKGIQKKML
jgi:hypothetical protein